jgi:hypothetical protein
MADAVIELETGPPEPERRRIPRLWLVLSLAGLLIVAGVAYALGQAARPKPPAPRNYVSSPGFSIYTGETGDAVFIITIHNYGPNPVAISSPKVTVAPGVTNVRTAMSLAEPTPDVDTAALAFPPNVVSVTIPPSANAHLTIGYHVGCDLGGNRGPFVLHATVEAAAGSTRSIRNVMPDINPSATYGIAYCQTR